jgi:hypothetical protein
MFLVDALRQFEEEVEILYDSYQRKHYHCQHSLVMDTEFLLTVIFWYQISAAGLSGSYHFQSP